MDAIDGFLLAIFIMGMGLAIAFGVFIPTATEHAEFVCESHGLELIEFEAEERPFSKVECGNKKPELQYDDYKVFTK